MMLNIAAIGSSRHYDADLPACSACIPGHIACGQHPLFELSTCIRNLSWYRNRLSTCSVGQLYWEHAVQPVEQHYKSDLDDSNFVGYVQRIVICCESNVRLLGAIRPADIRRILILKRKL